jgi:hypothetical protein
MPSSVSMLTWPNLTYFPLRDANSFHTGAISWQLPHLGLWNSTSQTSGDLTTFSSTLPESMGTPAPEATTALRAKSVDTKRSVRVSDMSTAKVRYTPSVVARVRGLRR